MLNLNNKFDPFAGPEIESVVFTTIAQSEIWTACYLGGKDGSRSYNESITLDFIGLLDSLAMNQAVQLLIERHEALRATFSTDGVYISICKQLTVELSDIDISSLEQLDQTKALEKYIDDDAHFLFDLNKGPLIKVGLITLSNNRHSLVITAHHIICDGWSIGIMLQDLGSIYSACVQNTIPNLPAPIPFSIYANEEKLYGVSDENKATEKFWSSIYENSIPIVNLPTDNPRPALRTFKGHRLDFATDFELLSNLKQIGLNNGSSLVTTLLTCFEVLIYQLTGQDDLVIGLPSAGQPVTGMNHLIGHCANLLPLRSKLNAKLSFTDYLKIRKSELYDAYDHSRLSFGQLLQKLNVARDPSRIPLVPIAFNIDLGMTDGVHFSNLKFNLKSNPKAFEAFEIFLNVSGTEQSLVFEWSFNENLFEVETVKKMMVSFENIIQKIVEEPSQTLGQLTSRDFTKQYIEPNAIKSNYPKSTLHELFAERVAISPDAIALEHNDQKLSYAELGKMINQIANYLWSQGLRPGQVVAVSLDRSPELIACLFAVLQCGASYVPIDTLYPDARVDLTIEDSNASFYIGLNLKTNFSTKVISLSIAEILKAIIHLSAEPINQRIAAESRAYIIYTSGSTGKPKGVQVAHCNVINLLYSMAAAPGINAKDKVFATTTISFDAMVMEIYLPLLFGACVVLVDENIRLNGKLLLEKASSDNITVIWGTPSIWQILIDTGWEKPLNIKALIGGELVPKPLAQKLLSLCSELWNIYGPTETTVCSSLTQINSTDDPLTIGKPVANTQIYLLDTKGIPVAQGEIGEIAIAGDGVSLGYLNRPELNEERFISNPFQNGSSGKMYLSGDLGKLLPNGHIQCLGRIDQQVKVRGYRIELGEIEHALIKLQSIKSAVVLAKDDILIAFIVVEKKDNDELKMVQSWRDELSSQLPYFMVPNVFHILANMPTTVNGKIDKKILLDFKSISENKKERTAPRTEEEKLVASIWEENLNLEDIDIFHNFFEMGGHSLKAVKVMFELEKRTGKKIPLSSLFEHSTVEKFAKLLLANNEIIHDFLVPIKPNGTKNPLFMVHGGGLNILNFATVIHNFDADQPVYGFQGIGPNGFDNWFESIEEMAARYIDSIIKINPKGPYALAGFSFGGIVAFEMARQLRQKGQVVSIIAALDTYLDSSYFYASYSQKKIIRYKDITRRRLTFLKEILTSWKALKLRSNAKREYILKKYFGFKDIMTEQEAVAFTKYIETSAMVNKIVDRYHLIPQDFEVELFRAKDDQNYNSDPDHLGWKKAALKGVNIHFIPGDHLNIVSPPNDKILARLLQDLLDKRHHHLQY
ncbi:amino acid adenylation domain-containing protein [Flavobacterium micromati]|uniref:Amino acid adenylation domain-containing protein n=1 Tax=Flavobacterium micromati TaxID=229205 RepID=A0A1M5QEU0_9FLAO|nr:non-ribosomal peptide synthetase [Flavobacterium micromati]SHH12269.1 amino acid adenylation domain-containing protein [Flavobacterium micromati]